MCDISVIIPVYNCEDLLIDCIKGVVNQTFSSIEVILVDDGSTDGSGRICDEFAQKDKRIIVFHVENGGPSKARNKGLQHAQGKYIYFIDSDDTVDLNCLEKVFMIAEKNSLELLSFGIRYIRGDSIEIKSYPSCIYISNNYELKKAFISYYKFCDVHSLCNKLYLRKFIDDNHIVFQEGTVVEEDLMFNLEVFQKINSMMIIPDVFYNYNCRESGSVTTKYNSDKFGTVKNAYIKQLAMFKDWQLVEFEQVLHNKYLIYVSAAINNLMYKQCNKTYTEKIRDIKGYFEDEMTKACLQELSSSGFRSMIMFIFVKYRCARLAYWMHYLIFRLRRG